jgi:hypothetical protein
VSLTTTEIAFGSALLGALVGGISTTIGGEWAATRRMRREELYRMHRDLVPAWRRYLERGIPKDGPAPVEVLAGLTRSAVIAGRGADAKMRAVTAAWDAMEASPMHETETPPPGYGVRPWPLSAERKQRLSELNTATDALADYLQQALS